MPTLTPGVNIISRGTVTPQTPPAQTDTVFIVGTTPMGRTDKPVLLRSLNDYLINFGPRQAWDTVYDWLDAFFNEGGGGQVYLQRAIHNTAALDTLTLNDAGAVASITVNSIGPAASGLSVAIVTGVAAGSYNIVVSGFPDGSSITSPDLFTVADAVNWSSTQLLFRVVAAGANPPANHAVTPLAGGSDAHAAIVDADKIAALALITKGLGPGQVAVPGSTTELVQNALLAHAFNNNRFAVIDTQDTASASTLIAAAAAIQVDGTIPPAQFEYGMVVSDWQVIPGLTIGTTRTVAPSAIACALMSRSDRASGNPNLAAAGANGIVQYALRKTQADWTDAQVASLVAAGVNPFHLVYGSERLYGFRTLANPSTDQVFVMASAARLRMAIVDAGARIGQSVLMDQIDGQQHEQAKYGNRIAGILLGYYNLGALFGATADQAYVVDVGADVNTPTTIANRELHAAVGIRPSPFAETVFFELASYAANQPV